ncbi:MAG: alanine--tRNA ligase [bacterium]|nr:alanine--tRNA ligase [bacterium]
MTGVNEIRSGFLNFFKKNNHEIVRSGSLVPSNDPTLMFTNAGMVPFKNLFTGLETRNYMRAVSAQKCVRAGGKHNDLDNVGFTVRHHTFFEMMGNFSFGDYFKDEAIYLAWQLITKEFGVDKDKLLVTVYMDDDEAFKIWKKITGFSDDRIIRIATSDNFWSMGETGPCGPCSEIFYDHGEHIPGGPPGAPDEDGDRFVEIWNLVFMQYEQLSSGKRIDLPKPSIDTGMGLERMAALMQGTNDNYQTDLFKALINASIDASGVDSNGTNNVSHRVIADHLRSCSFLIADGVLPSNEGRGYVLRRIMRRAMRHGNLLGVSEPILYKLLPTLIREMGEAYPELVRAKALISETLQLEEISFRKTLDRGISLLESETASLKDGDELSGEVAFKLYDTYGFPLDLTQDALKDHDISVDIKAFDKAMERQRAEARKNWSGSGDTATEQIWLGQREKLGATEFLGYNTQQALGSIAALIKNEKPVKKITKGDEASLVANQTPFYGEAGGQIGDTGIITGGMGARFVVSDTQKKAGDLVVHIGHVESGQFVLGESIDLVLNEQKRSTLKANHSATHLLHQALRLVLGDHVTQKGSQVTPDRLRFDFSHPKALSTTELEEIEKITNQIVLQNGQVSTRLMGQDEAIEAGAMALFGEKYGDEVRVVSMGMGDGGNQDANNYSDNPYSVELCGGTHVERTGDIGLIRIVSEIAVAAGVRRIEALSGQCARAYLGDQDNRLKEVSDILKTTPSEVPERLRALVDERKNLEKALAEARRKLVMGGSGGSGGDDIRSVGKLKYMARSVEGIPPKDLRGLVDDGKQQIGSGVVAFVTVTEEGKAGLSVGVTIDLTGQYDAVDLVKAGSKILGGKGGGGRPDMAQAGGPDGSKAEAALDAIEKRISELVGDKV